MALVAANKGKGKRPPSPRLVLTSEIQPKMLDGAFEGKILNRYGTFDIPGSKYKFIHVDLVDREGYCTITLTAADSYADKLTAKLIPGLFVRVSNFSVNLKHGMFEHGDSSFSLRVGSVTAVEHIEPFEVAISFLPTHSVKEFLVRQCLNELGTLELVVVAVVGRNKKNFILTVADSKEAVYSFVFYVEFYAEYVVLAEKCTRGEVATFLVKNVTSATQGENYLATCYSSIIVTPVPDAIVEKELTEVFKHHSKEHKNFHSFQILGVLTVPIGTSIYEETCDKCHMPNITKRDHGSYCSRCHSMVTASSTLKISCKITTTAYEIYECTVSKENIGRVLGVEINSVEEFNQHKKSFLRKLNLIRVQGLFSLNPSSEVIDFTEDSKALPKGVRSFVEDNLKSSSALELDTSLQQPDSFQVGGIDVPLE